MVGTGSSRQTPIRNGETVLFSYDASRVRTTSSPHSNHLRSVKCPARDREDMGNTSSSTPGLSTRRTGSGRSITGRYGPKSGVCQTGVSGTEGEVRRSVGVPSGGFDPRSENLSRQRFQVPFTRTFHLRRVRDPLELVQVPTSPESQE